MYVVRAGGELSPGARNRAGGPRDPILRRNREPRYWQHFSSGTGNNRSGGVCALSAPFALLLENFRSNRALPSHGEEGNNAITRAKLRSTLGGVSREKGSAISSKIDAIAEQARTMERRGGGGKIGNKDFHFCFFASPPSYRAVLEARGFDRMRFLESLRVFGESLPLHVSANLPLCFPSFPFVSFSFLRPRILLFFSSFPLFLLLSFPFLSLSFSFPSFRFKIFIF